MLQRILVFSVLLTSSWAYSRGNVLDRMNNEFLRDGDSVANICSFEEPMGGGFGLAKIKKVVVMRTLLRDGKIKREVVKVGDGKNEVVVEKKFSANSDVGKRILECQNQLTALTRFKWNERKQQDPKPNAVAKMNLANRKLEIISGQERWTGEEIAKMTGSDPDGGSASPTTAEAAVNDRNPNSSSCILPACDQGSLKKKESRRLGPRGNVHSR